MCFVKELRILILCTHVVGLNHSISEIDRLGHMCNTSNVITIVMKAQRWAINEDCISVNKPHYIPTCRRVHSNNYICKTWNFPPVTNLLAVRHGGCIRVSCKFLLALHGEHHMPLQHHLLAHQLDPTLEI